MRFAIDVAFLDRKLVVVDVDGAAAMAGRPTEGEGKSVLEAQAGAFERWGLKVGDELELRRGE